MGTAEVQELLAAKFEAVFPHLDERQRRLVMGAEARVLGHGGIKVVAAAADVSAVTVSRGVAELEGGGEPLGRARRPGGGRKRVVGTDPELKDALLALVDPESRGDPESPLRWTTKSLRALAAELARQGHRASADTVADLLHEEGFSLQGNARVMEGARHPDRDAQFRYINEQVKAHRDTGDPVVSVDAKKKEQAGNYAGQGREYAPKGRPVRVRDHDFPDPADPGKAIPYGIYDLAANTGWVNVGTDTDTAAFAVESIRRWWNAAGRAAYPGAGRLLITADAGGSNGYRTRAWKTGLAELAVQAGLDITVCHFPPGTSKWNKIEHRLFSCISMNWRGRPLSSHEVIVQAIAATTTRTGLTVHAELDTGLYPAGVKVSDQQMAALPLRQHSWHGEWNYTLRPLPFPCASPGPAAALPPHPDRTWLAAPALTGLTPAQWDKLTAQLAIARHLQREAMLHQQRGGTRQIAPGTGRKPAITLTDRIMITLLEQRFCLPRPVLARLYHVTPRTIAGAIPQTRALLNLTGHTAEPASTQLATLADLIRYATNAGIHVPQETKTAC